MQFSYPHVRKDSDKMKCSKSLAKISWGLESMSLHKKIRMSKLLASPEKKQGRLLLNIHYGFDCCWLPNTEGKGITESSLGYFLS